MPTRCPEQESVRQIIQAAYERAQLRVHPPEPKPAVPSPDYPEYFRYEFNPLYKGIPSFLHSYFGRVIRETVTTLITDVEERKQYYGSDQYPGRPHFNHRMVGELFKKLSFNDLAKVYSPIRGRSKISLSRACILVFKAQHPELDLSDNTRTAIDQFLTALISEYKTDSNSPALRQPIVSHPQAHLLIARSDTLSP